MAVQLCSCESAAPMIAVTVIDNPAPSGARLPSVALGTAGVILNWVETHAENSDAQKSLQKSHLRYAQRQDSHWSTPVTVASGTDWFVNWADFPAMFWQEGSGYFAHWLQKSGANTYSYDVMTSVSKDGSNWNAPSSPHHDQTPTEHGFASWLAWEGNSALVWLDGRNTYTESTADSPSNGTATTSNAAAHHASTAGPMTLRMAVISDPQKEHVDLLGNDSLMSTELDASVCDCCQTSAVNTIDGAIVFYRDRTDDEIRDIAYRRYSKQQKNWSPSKILHDDHWEISGCPVNGPQADAINSTVAVAWFTAAKQTAKVQISVSTDAGKHFSSPVRVNQSATQGRVDLALLSEERLLVSWVRQDSDDYATVMVSAYNTELKHLDDYAVATISAARRSGFPRLVAMNPHQAMIAWTDVTDHTTHIRTAIIELATRL